MKRIQAGFTLVELLVVIGILAVLTAVVLVAVNPGRQFAQARDTQRRADVNTVSAAVIAYIADPNNTGDRTLVGLGIETLCTAGSHTIGSGTGELDLAATLAPVYVAALPVEPSNGAYTVCVNDAASNRFTVSATPELATQISVTR